MRAPVVTFLMISLIGCGGNSTKKTPSLDGGADLSVTDLSTVKDLSVANNDLLVTQPDLLAATGDMAQVSQTLACTTYATNYCNLQATCNPNTPFTKYNGLQDCIERREQACVNALNAPSTGATPNGTLACANVLAAIDCVDFGNNVLPSPCRTATGSLANGADCNFDAQCQSGFCGIGPASNCGQCFTPSQPGDDCSQTNFACFAGSLGLYCSKLDNTCKVHSAAGAPCDQAAACGYRLDCVGAKPAQGVAGTCVPTNSVPGAPCSQNKPSPSPSPSPGLNQAGCDATMNLLCVGTKANNMTCVPTVYASPMPSVSPTPCGMLPSGSYALCVGGAQCVITDNKKLTGSCAGPALDNGSCDTAAANEACEQPSVCVGNQIDGGVSGTCAFPGATYCQ